MAFSKGTGKFPTRAEVRAFGKEVSKGQVFTNRWSEHQWVPGERRLTVVADVPGKAFFILEDQYGATTWMRSRTLMRRYRRVY